MLRLEPLAAARCGALGARGTSAGTVHALETGLDGSRGDHRGCLCGNALRHEACGLGYSIDRPLDAAIRGWTLALRPIHATVVASVRAPILTAPVAIPVAIHVSVWAAIGIAVVAAIPVVSALAIVVTAVTIPVAIAELVLMAALAIVVAMSALPVLAIAAFLLAVVAALVAVESLLPLGAIAALERLRLLHAGLWLVRTHHGRLIAAAEIVSLLRDLVVGAIVELRNPEPLVHAARCRIAALADLLIAEGEDDAIVMFGMLEVVLSKNLVAGRFRVAR